VAATHVDTSLTCRPWLLPLPTKPLYSQNVQALLLPFIRGTALHSAYVRLLGARIAPDSVLDAEDVSEYDLIDIQQGAFVGGNAVISPGNKMAVSSKQVGLALLCRVAAVQGGKLLCWWLGDADGWTDAACMAGGTKSSFQASPMAPPQG
jgi:hypothetical protein